MDLGLDEKVALVTGSYRGTGSARVTMSWVGCAPTGDGRIW
jgi:hypothetical protein